MNETSVAAGGSRPRDTEFLHRDGQHSAERALAVFHHYDPATIDGGAALRGHGILNALRHIMPTDVVSVADLRRAVGHGEFCPAPEPVTMETPSGRMAAPYRAEFCSSAAKVLESVVRRPEYRLTLLSDIQIHTYAAAVRAACRCQLVIDLHNAEAQLYQDMVTHPDWGWAGHLSDRNGAWLPAIRQVERQLVGMADAVTVPSEQVRQTLARHGLGTPIILLPNAVPVHTTERPRELSPPERCVFVGALRYFPNALAALEIIERIGPQLHAVLPGMPISVVGRNPPDFLLAAAQHSPVSVVADPDDVRPFFERSIQLVPLSIGGGTRLKILEGFASGSSTVSTTKGIEGIDATRDEHYLLAENAVQFVAAVQQILDDPVTDLRRRQSAWDLVNRCYSWAALQTAYLRLLDQL